MIDKTTLSKHKYIYRIYEDGTDEVHFQKFPIVYLNSKVVYFKDARKQEYLANVEVRKVFDNFGKFIEDKHGSASWRDIDDYFWDIDGNLQELFMEWKKHRRIEKLRAREKQITDRYLRARKEFEKAEEELIVLAQIKENDND